MAYEKAVTAQTILVDFSDFFCDSHGDLSKQFSHISSFGQAQQDSIVFVMDGKRLEKALQSKAGCVLAPLKMKDKADDRKTWLFSKNVELAACMLKRKLQQTTPYHSSHTGIHATAVVSQSAEIGKNVNIGPNAYVGENCKIADNCFIGANAIVESNSSLGEGTTIHPLAYIGHSSQIGKACEVMPQAVVGSEGFGYAHDHLGNHYRIPHTGRVVLEDDVHVGSGTCIDRGTLDDSVIGRGTKIDNQCHFAHNSVIGQNGLVTAQFVNAGSAKIGNNFMSGGKAVVAGHTTTTDNVHIAALGVIHKDVDKPGQYGGYPLQPVREFFKTKATLNHITEMRKQINQLMKAVFQDEKN